MENGRGRAGKDVWEGGGEGEGEVAMKNMSMKQQESESRVDPSRRLPKFREKQKVTTDARVRQD